MKVICSNIFNEFKKEFQQSSHSLTVGKEYVVLEMLVSPEKRIYYRLISDNNDEPVLFNASQFEIVSHQVYSNWGIFSLKDHSIVLRPHSWAVKGFWERVYNHEDEMLEIYKHEAGKIISEEN